MTTTATLRRRYGSDAVGTASPAQLVVMLYDRLAQDLYAAGAALESRSTEAAHHALVHAQEVVCELLASLDTSRWPEGEGLASLYRYLLERLEQANVHKDQSVVAECLEVVDPLREAWRQASTIPAVSS